MRAASRHFVCTMSTLNKHMLKELLLVCSALGSVETSAIEENADDENDAKELAPQSHRFVRGENCLEWLQDLQRLVAFLLAYPSCHGMGTSFIKKTLRRIQSVTVFQTGPKLRSYTVL